MKNRFILLVIFLFNTHELFSAAAEGHPRVSGAPPVTDFYQLVLQASADEKNWDQALSRFDSSSVEEQKEMLTMKKHAAIVTAVSGASSEKVRHLVGCYDRHGIDITKIPVGRLSLLQVAQRVDGLGLKKRDSVVAYLKEKYEK